MGIYKKIPLLEVILFLIMSFAVVVDYANAFFLLPLFIVLFVQVVKKKNISAIIAAFLPMALLFYYNYQAFGNIFTLSYTHYRPPSYVLFDSVAKSFSLSNIPQGLYGLLLSPSRGLFLMSPITVLGVVVFWHLYKEKRWRLFAISLTAVTGIIVFSAYSLWHGGHCIGYRHILYSAIIFAFLSALFIKKYKKVKVAAVVLLAFSCLTGVTSFFIQLDKPLLALTWKAEPANVHTNFYSELLLPFILKH